MQMAGGRWHLPHKYEEVLSSDAQQAQKKWEMTMGSYNFIAVGGRDSGTTGTWC